MKHLLLALSACCLLVTLQRSSMGQDKAIRPPISVAAESSDRNQDGLIGPVRRVRVETAKIAVKGGNFVEGPRVLSGVATYDPKGRKVDFVAYPVEGGTLPGKEEYSYDDKGNIVEMVLRGNDGAALSKETYKYELDEMGNWKKMISSVAVYEDGKASYEPIEVTYRTIAYYYDQAVDKLVSSASGLEARSNSTTPAPPMPLTTPGTEAPAASRVSAVGSSAANSSRNDSRQMGDRDKDGLNESPTGNPKSKLAEKPLSSVSSPLPNVPPPADVSAGDNSATALYEQGLTHLTASRYAEAVETLRQSTRLNPNEAHAYLKLGLAHSMQGQHEEALTALKMAIQIKPEAVDAQAYYHLGHAYAALGKFSNALESFKQSLYITRAEALDDTVKTKNSPPPEQLHLGIGVMYHNLQRNKDAIKELKQAIALNPRLPQAHYVLAVFYLAVGNRSSAEDHEKTLRSIDPALAKRIAEAISNPSLVLHCRSVFGPCN